MNVLIVDDEPLARSRLQRLLEDFSDYNVIGEADNGHSALTLADRLQPDVILMDIRMPGMDGLEAAQHLTTLEQPPAIIFTTAYSDHALDAFQTHALGYLMKPIRKEKLERALHKAIKPNRAQLTAAVQEERQGARSHICVRQRGNLNLIPVPQILYFLAEHKYVTIHHKEGEDLIEDSLKLLQEEFADSFTRIHRNALVANQHLSGIVKNNEGGYMICFRNSEQRLDISRRHLPAVRKKLKSMQLS